MALYNCEGAEVIAQGAEAVVLKIKYLGLDAVVKRRVPKAYRHELLDQNLTRNRMTSECRSIAKLRKQGVYVPAVYLADFTRLEVISEYVRGVTVFERLSAFSNSNEDLSRSLEVADMLEKIGAAVAKMHNCNVIHGDLTTRNMIFTGDGALCLIDFGLAYTCTLVEDKAVDLYVLERCCTSSEFDVILESYVASSKQGNDILSRLQQVRLRGRKRDLAG